ncbi:MAG: sugar transferase [Actinomycetota bacterium]
MLLGRNDATHDMVAPGEVHDTPGRRVRAVARSVDVFLAAVAVFLLAVPVLVIALLVKLSDRGPALFAQRRIGRDGRAFTLLKFRTMRVGTFTILQDPIEGAHYRANGFKLDANDDRITPLGRVLRRTSIDELPQLINVLWGEMRMVGVRPLLAEELALRSANDQEAYRRFAPGMTGRWQVDSRHLIGDIDRGANDRTYVEEWSLLGDLRLLLRTPAALLAGDHGVVNGRRARLAIAFALLVLVLLPLGVVAVWGIGALVVMAVCGVVCVGGGSLRRYRPASP